jgi:uncharacterized integral membrane protein
MNRLERPEERRRRQREGFASAMRLLFFIVGSALNLLALVLMFANIVTVSRLFLAGQPVTFGGEYLAPFGAFLGGIICYVIAWQFD